MYLYEVEIKPTKDGRFWGYVKEKPGVASFAETEGELLENLKDALKVMTLAEHLLKDKKR